MANKTPKEIWVKIWSLVDFKTLQKSCTVVCKNWREGIRGNASLSDHMTLNNEQKSLEDINEVLSNWEALKIIRMSREMSNDELLQLAPHPSLEKIIFPKNYELGIWGEVTKVCFDLNNKSYEGVENIVELHLLDFFNGEEAEENISLEAMARMMVNLETLHVFREFDCDWIYPEKMKYFSHFFRGLQNCKNLSELFLPTYFEEYVNYTPNIKKLEIKGNCEFGLEELDWIANLEKLEILKLEMLRFEDKETDIEDFTRKMFGRLTHLKILEFDDCSLMYEPEFLVNILEIIPSLETLIMTKEFDNHFPMDIDYLVAVLDSIGNVKNLHIKEAYPAFYLLNNKDFRRTIPNDKDEDQIKAVLQNAMDVINKKFSTEATSIEIVDNEYGWTIKKDKGKQAKLTQLPYKCTAKDEQGKTCTEFFLEKAEWEKHEKDGLKWGYLHSFPHCYL